MSKKDTALLQSLERSGMLGLTKAYLQTQILENLRNQNSTSSSLSKTLSESKNKNIFALLRLAYSIIYDFLIKMNLSYSQQTFNSEMKELLSNSNIPFQDSEIINLLNVNINDFEEAKKILLSNSKDPIITNQGNKLGSTFIFYLMKKNSSFLKNDNECQTEVNLINIAEKGENLSPSINNVNNFSNVEERLKQIEDKNNKKNNNNENFPSQLIENRFLKYKDECDKRYQEQLNNEINRFKNIELSEMRIEENKKYNENLNKIREDYDIKYNEKLNELKKEKNKLKEKEKELENDYEKKENENRKILDDKINYLKEKENDLQKKYENELNDIKLQKEKLKNKEQEIDYIKETEVSKIKNEIEKVKNDYEKKLNEEKKKLEEERENISKEKSDKKSQQKTNNYIYIKENTNDNSSNLNNENIELRNELNNMKKNLDNMRNKYMLENNELRDTINKLNKNLNDIQNENINNNNYYNLRSPHLNNNYIDNNYTYQQLAKNESDMNTLKEEIKDFKKEMKKEIKKYNPNLNNSNLQNSYVLNQTMPIQHSHLLNQNKNSKKIPNKQNNKYNNTQKIVNKGISPNLAKKLTGFKDRRKILQQLEEEQYKLNNEIRSEFKNLMKDEVPIVVLDSDDIEKIKKNNYYNNVLINEAREKELNELYRKQNNNERLIDKIQFMNNYEKNYEKANEKNKDSKIIIINKEDNNYQNKLNNIEKNSNQSGSQASSINEVKKAENEKIESKFTQMYDINKKSAEFNKISNEFNKNSNEFKNNEIKKEDNNKNIPMTSSITSIPAQNNQMKNSDLFNVENTEDVNNRDLNKNSNIYQPSIGGILSNQNNMNNKQFNTSIREEIDENIGESIIDNSKNNNSKSINKFTNIDYESNNNNNINYNNTNRDTSNNDIDEYNDFEDPNFDKKQSIQSFERNRSNSISMNKSSIKESIVGKNNTGEIEENIEKESASSNLYNDFETSNNLVKKGITGNTGNTSSGNQVKTLSENEIKEEIVNSEDDGGYY